MKKAELKSSIVITLTPWFATVIAATSNGRLASGALGPLGGRAAGKRRRYGSMLAGASQRVSETMSLGWCRHRCGESMMTTEVHLLWAYLLQTDRSLKPVSVGFELLAKTERFAIVQSWQSV